jgi:hypothetical protein
MNVPGSVLRKMARSSATRYCSGPMTLYTCIKSLRPTTSLLRLRESRAFVNLLLGTLVFIVCTAFDKHYIRAVAFGACASEPIRSE